MNFLSHYYCAQVKQPYYILGVLIPDIFHKFSFFHNKYFTKYNPEALNEDERMLWAGIEQHYGDDAYFHNMASFKALNKQIEDAMARMDNLIPIKRKFLISHILYELILDHMILERESNMVSELYFQLEKVEKKTILQFYEKIMGKQKEIDLFLESYDRFMMRRFLNFYAEESNLVKALHRVTGTISQWEYNPSIESDFLNIIRLVKSQINFDETFDNIKTYKLNL